MNVNHSLEISKPLLIGYKVAERVGCLDNTADVHSDTNSCHQSGEHLVIVPEIFKVLFAEFSNLETNVDPGVHHNKEQYTLQGKPNYIHDCEQT